MFMAAGSSNPGGYHVQDPGNGAVPVTKYSTTQS